MVHKRSREEIKEKFTYFSLFGENIVPLKGHYWNSTQNHGSSLD